MKYKADSYCTSDVKVTGVCLLIVGVLSVGDKNFQRTWRGLTDKALASRISNVQGVPNQNRILHMYLRRPFQASELFLDCVYIEPSRAPSRRLWLRRALSTEHPAPVRFPCMHLCFPRSQLSGSRSS